MTEQELRDDMIYSGVLVGELLRELNRRCHKCAREGSSALAEEWQSTPLPCKMQCLFLD